MPRHIDGVRYWTDEEIMQRYRQGRTDAGHASDTTVEYTEQQLKEAYEKGYHLNERMVSIAARAAYEEALNVGEKNGYAKGYEEGIKPIKQQVEQAKKEGIEEGKKQGLQESQENIRRIQNERGRSDVKIAEEAVNEYKKNQKLSIRVQSFFKQFKVPGNAPFLHKLYEVSSNIAYRTVGKIPVWFVPTDLWMPNTDPYERFHRFHTKTVFPLRLNHFRYAPGKVGSALAASFTGVLLAKYFFARIRDQYAHGEDYPQYRNRKEVVNSCQKLEKINNKVPLNPEEGTEMGRLQRKCKAAQKFFDSMEEVMKTRRELKIGDQRFFGQRQDAGFRDEYDNSKDKYIPKESITSDIPLFEKRLAERLSRPK